MKTITHQELLGRIACQGIATGGVVVVQSPQDLDIVTEGDILVAAETDVTFVPAMQRAAAIVTEAGGRFCHAAIWARENDKPTLLQVSEATRVLRNVATVTVDATIGKVTWEVPS